MKSKRQEKILEVIDKYNIDTQDELLKRLSDMGVEATQATISRDIKELKLIKVATPDSKYKYAVATPGEFKASAKFSNIISETLVNVDYAGNQIVLKTYSGMANAAAAAIDAMGWNEILGTIAGDDTILIIARDAHMAEELVSRFKVILG